MIEPVYEELPPELVGTPNPDHEWIERELDRINPDRMEMDDGNDWEAMSKLVLEQRDRLLNAAGVLKVKRLHPDAIIPAYQTAGAACFDLHALDEGRPHPRDPHAAIFRTGLAFEVPHGWAMMIYSRSGHGFKNGVRLSNSVGVIDSDYRGEIKVALHNDSRAKFKVANGERIAQAMLMPVPRVNMVETEQLSETDRGTGGFGSTGR